MKLELKAIEHSERLSQETYCYSAKLYVDGKAFAYIENRGHGGCDTISRIDYKAQDAKEWDAKLQEIELHLKTETPEVDLGEGMTCENSLELWAGEQVEKWLTMKDMKTAMRSKMLFTKGEEIAYFPKKQRGRKVPDSVLVTHIKQKYPSATILNTLPAKDALEIWEKSAS